MKRTLWIAACLLAPSTQAYSASDQLSNCRYENGLPMDAADCKAFQDIERKKEERKTLQDQYTRKALEDGEAANKFDLLEKERRRAEAEAARAKHEAEMGAERARVQSWMASQDREEQLVAKRADADEKARKQACGADYKKPKIGMPIQRIQDCVARIRLTSELNRADGTMSTYESAGARFYVMHGKVVAWGFK